MPFSNRTRKVGTVTGAENVQRSIDMPRKHLYREIIIEVLGELDITTLGAPVLVDDPFSGAFACIRRIELIANGRDTVKSISGTALAMKNTFLYGVPPVSTALDDANAVTDIPFGGVLMLPLASPRAVRQIDTLLHTGKLSTLELRITFGAEADLFTTAPTLTENFEISVNVALHETIRLDGKDENYATYKESFQEKQITAATQNFQFLLPVGNRYRGLMIETESDKDMVDTILNTLTLKSGTDGFRSLDGTQIKGMNRILALGGNWDTQGYYYVDFCPEGRLIDGLDASILSMLELVLDVNAPGTADYLRVYPDETIFPIGG